MKNFEIENIIERESDTYEHSQRYDYEFYCDEYGSVSYQDIYVNCFGTPTAITWYVNPGVGFKDFYIHEDEIPDSDEYVETDSGVWNVAPWKVIAEHLINQ